MTAVFAGDVVAASDPNDLETRIAALEAKGYVTSAIDSSSNTSTTTTEVVSTSIQFTASASPVRYKVTLISVAESTVANDLIIVRMRWKNSGTADTTGTAFAVDTKTAITASKGDAFCLVGDFNTQTGGVVTVVATIVRGSGATGTVKQNLSASGQQGYFLVEII